MDICSGCSRIWLGPENDPTKLVGEGQKVNLLAIIYTPDAAHYNLIGYCLKFVEIFVDTLKLTRDIG